MLVCFVTLSSKLEFYSLEIWYSVPLGCYRNKFRVILFTTGSFKMGCKNKLFRLILLFYFHKGKKTAEDYKEICEVYGIDCLTERTCKNDFKNTVLEIYHCKVTNVLVDLLKLTMSKQKQ